MQCSGERLRCAELFVSFRGEDGIDQGGLRREWHGLFFDAVFCPDVCLFRSTDGATFFPARESEIVDPDHLSTFEARDGPTKPGL